MTTVLHLIDTTGPGGAETVFIQLADKMRTQGYQSVVVIRGPGWVQDQLVGLGLEPLVIPAKGSFALKFLCRLIMTIRKHKVDIIQSHLLGSNVYAAMAGLATATPVVATYHGMVDVNPNERFKGLKNAVMRWGIHHYVAVSQGLMDNIRDQKLLDIDKASVIYNGVDLDDFNRPVKGDLRESLQLPPDAVLIGSLGNVRPAKAYDVLIDAAAILLPRFPHLHFVVAGHKKPTLMARLDKQMKELQVAGNFHFTGFCQDCADFLKQVDLFVLSSSSEGFSIATIEAMAAGLPVVVTRCGGPEEIVTAEQDGVLVNPQDPKALADALARLLLDKPLAQRLAEAGRAHVNATFSLRNILAKYHQIYQSACSKK